MKNLHDKVVVITGAGSGIGRSLALKMYKQGAKLALNDFNKEALDETLSMIDNPNSIYHEIFNVSIKKDFDQFAKNVVNHYKKVDVVVNNAGITIGSYSSLETTIENYEKVIGINMWGMIYGTLNFLPELRKQEESSIVNISSIWGLIGSPYQSAYSVSKFAIRGFSEALAAEEFCNNSGVVVTSVHPGGVKTNIVRNIEGQNLTENQLKKLDAHFPTTANQTADKIITAIKKKKTRITIGPDAKFMYRLSRFSQRITMKFMVNWAKKMMKTQQWNH
ncbi:MAG: SDR family oxidoreductase [Flavobacteriaceae bacterium]|nr:SDR family oxidoreductase [Flavobacteriaceae bacterium]